MLAIISDLHFCDGTAIQGNVAPEVFALALREIHEIAERVARARDRPTHVDLVFLGDIFDLLRTERWLEDAAGHEVPLSDRPWATAEAARTGALSPAASARARGILAEILEINAGALATLRGEAAPPPPGVEVRRVYIPGNHDRLYLHDAELQARILGALGAVGGEALAAEGGSRHHLAMPAYATVARHGHEWDVWNFPGFDPDKVAADYTDADYLPTPIGDAVTTEMATRLPFELGRRLASSPGFSPGLAARIRGHFRRIEDVRPLFASFHWAYYAASQIAADLDPAEGRRLHAALTDTVQSLARDLRGLDFYHAWIDRHHRPYHLDAALLLRVILFALSLPCLPIGWISRQIERVLVGRNPMSTTRRGALREPLDRVGDREMRFVVYGHTHGPEQVPLHGGPVVQDVYLNTGTYRPGVFRADDGEGFVGWQRLAYVVIGSAEEAVGLETPFGMRYRGPAFVSWDGARSPGAASRAGLAPIR